MVACSLGSYLHCPRSRTPVELWHWRCRPVGDSYVSLTCWSHALEEPERPTEQQNGDHLGMGLRSHKARTHQPRHPLFSKK